MTSSALPTDLKIVIGAFLTSGTVHLSPRRTDPMEIAGRGLALVDALATAWAAEHQADGTTVWFEIERSA